MPPTRSPLPVVEVRQPCTRSWDAMRGDDRSRFCSHCGKTVHNLSAMPADEAARLLCESAGPLCIRFARRPDGGVATIEYDPPAEPTGWRRRSWRFWTGVGIIGALLSGVAHALIPGRPPFGGGGPVLMGAYCPPTTMPATAPTTSPSGEGNDTDRPSDSSLG